MEINLRPVREFLREDAPIPFDSVGLSAGLSKGDLASKPEGRICTKCDTWKLRKEMGANKSKTGMSSHCKACKRRDTFEISERKRSERICKDCPSQVAEGKSRCRSCLERIKNSRDKKTSSGICRDCRAESLTGKIYCQPCLDRLNRQLKTMKQDRKKRCECLRCSGKIAVPGVLCDKCRLYESLSSIVRHTLNDRLLSKGGSKWESFVDFTFEELVIYINYWKTLQGLDGSQVEIHHINPRSESQWEIPGDEEWRRLWALENLIPLTRKAHDEAHAEKYENIHPDAAAYIKRTRKRDIDHLRA